MPATSSGSGVVRATPSGGTLADVLDRILDKGIVIDAWARISLVGLEILTVEARIVVASVETYLKYAEAIRSLDVAAKPPEEEARPASIEVQPQPSAAPAALSADDVVWYLSDHTEGLRLEDLEEHFHVPHAQLEEVVQHLVDEQKVRKDKKRDLFLPAEASPE